MAVEAFVCTMVYYTGWGEVVVGGCPFDLFAAVHLPLS